jgi:hypothetical protein
MRTPLLALFASASVLWAGSFTHNGDTTDQPVWNRPVQNGSSPPDSLSGVGTAVPYDSLAFGVSEFGTYSFLLIGTDPLSWDIYGALYADQFDPGEPLADCRRAADAEIPGLVAFSYDLNPGVQYYFVTTGFLNWDFGKYELQLSGPGAIAPWAGDSDSDGVPNAWELFHGTDPLTADAEADPDGDGFTNLQEYQAGTAPQDAASHLQLGVKNTAPGTAEIYFLAAPDRYHRVLSRPAPYSGAWDTVTNVPPAAGAAPVLVQVPITTGGSPRYYRLEAGLGGG